MYGKLCLCQVFFLIIYKIILMCLDKKDLILQKLITTNTFLLTTLMFENIKY